ncbi:hypothetical protein L2E82_46416 [Cichorium intybus]|uniref:Uncharacterized protein n=1 Tax=Cichorium intybus TaxID=13427 RepID=A0ACB8YU72_CICIN|nr:hypothetical protein L2E82_46416 [Cichorium intybus]
MRHIYDLCLSFSVKRIEGGQHQGRDSKEEKQRKKKKKRGRKESKFCDLSSNLPSNLEVSLGSIRCAVLSLVGFAELPHRFLHCRLE